jgi:hypothetical protein
LQDSRHNIESTLYELTEVVRQKAESGVMHNSIKLRKSLNTGVFNQLTIDLTYPDLEKVSHENLQILKNLEARTPSQTERIPFHDIRRRPWMLHQ